ncbi:dienelactone hydrolase family protein [Rubritalea tangerina]|uniref:Dienelactone hydrolase family protein n=1 Tax=Rubritalea tangerina TaxID=430798 RepID=A0ABW4ZA69_9BACT
MLNHLTTWLCLSSACLAAGLSQPEANAYIKEATEKQKQTLTKERQADFDNKKIELDGKTLPYAFLKYGEEPEGGHSLYISMHGGGSAPPAVNDRQWQNQIRLYKPKEGYYLAPRAATNTWNLWHEAHIDPMFDRIIENFVALKGVNPNKVYLTGYSAGGDGTYQLAPRMADRWAAAAMMAGHPNEAQPDNLYNLPFFIQCGGKDAAYDRNKIAAEWGKKLDALAAKHPGAYPHKTIIYPELGHWMDGKDAVAIPWMASKTRSPWPQHIVWFQDDVTVQRFYWLENPNPQKGQKVTANVSGQTITLDTKNIPSLTLRLSDQLVDLDKELIVKSADDKELFRGKVQRDKKSIDKSLKQRFDPTTVATAELTVTF